MPEVRDLKQFARSDNGFAVTLDNGWCIDASFGKGDYADNRHAEFEFGSEPEILESNTCETCIWDADGNDQTFAIAKQLQILHSGFRVDGDARLAVIPFLKFSDWLRIVNYINGLKR